MVYLAQCRIVLSELITTELHQTGTILHYTILYYTILYYTILYYTILYYTILYYTILYYTTLWYSARQGTKWYNSKQLNLEKYILFVSRRFIFSLENESYWRNSLERKRNEYFLNNRKCFCVKYIDIDQF